MLWVMSTSTRARVDCDVAPCSTPTKTPGATYLPPLTVGPVEIWLDGALVACGRPLAVVCDRLVPGVAAEPLPKSSRSSPTELRSRSSRPGPPLARLAAA